ncbi:MAG TPA: hypothetical protein VK302_11030 [Terriglobales bacterium]|nr:hypothetical protein [Terriglobales bacterium]
MTLDELKDQCRWVMWRREVVKGRDTKVPRQPDGHHAQNNNRATWRTYAECMAVVSQFSGVGVVTGDGVTSTDLDDVIVDGEILPEAMAIVAVLDSYTEITPSGTGLLILTRSTLSGPNIGFVAGEFSGEIRGAGAFHTFTGKHLDGTPRELMPRQAEIEALYKRFSTPIKSVGDGAARPQAVEKFVRRFTAYAEDVCATITAVKTTGGKTLVLTSPCLLHDDHDGGVGITADGIRCVQCFHSRCKSLGWGQWSKAVEQKHGPMRLEGKIKWKR